LRGAAKNWTKPVRAKKAKGMNKLTNEIDAAHKF
jgi:hypothetical protein